MKNLGILKKWYVEVRYGAGVITPLFSYSSSVLIVYNFTNLKMIPFPIFTVFFTIGLLAIFLGLGRIFRLRQLSTDQDLIYAQQKESARTQKIILEALYEIMESSNKKLDVYERIQYLKQIEQSKRKP